MCHRVALRELLSGLRSMLHLSKAVAQYLAYY